MGYFIPPFGQTKSQVENRKYFSRKYFPLRTPQQIAAVMRACRANISNVYLSTDETALFVRTACCLIVANITRPALFGRAKTG